MSEHLQATPGGPGIPGHPELEELAALADGKLSRADAARVRAHLGSCEECYEVFAETLHLMEELQSEEDESGGDVVPGPFDKRRKYSPWWTAAVAALLVVGVGVGVWRILDTGPRFSVTDLAASGRGTALGKLAWGETLRGGAVGKKAEVEASAFQAGVALLNLQTALVSKEWDAADSAAAQVNRILGINGQKDPRDGAPAASNYDYLASSSRNFYGGLRERIKGKPQSLAHEAAKQAEALRSSGSFEEDQPYFDLGMWAEAGRLAAAQHRPFAQGKEASHLLRQLEKARDKEKDADLPDEVVKALQDIDQTSADDYPKLKRAFETILKHYYPQGQPFEEAP